MSDANGPAAASGGPYGATYPTGAAPAPGQPYAWQPGYVPQPGYAAYPAQPYGAPGPYAYPIAPRTNTLAIVSFVASVAAFLILPVVGSIVGIVTGHMALSQLRTSGEGGRGLALAGTILGWCAAATGILVIIALVAFFAPFTWSSVTGLPA